MTCAHVVNAALKKVVGVETVEVSLNKGLATVKLKPENTVSVPELWQLIHDKGYTPKAATVTARGELADVSGRLKLKIAGTRDIVALSEDPANPAAFAEAGKRLGQTAIIRGVMTPGKNLKTPVPLQVSQVQ
jgi:copper chaperone CopZ